MLFWTGSLAAPFHWMCFDGGLDVDSDFVGTHENMTDCFASIDPLHPALLESNKPLFEQMWRRDERGK